MYADFMTALSALNTIIGLGVTTEKVKVDSAVAQRAIDLQGAIISLQTAMMGIQAQNQELLDENNDLKQQLASAENWEAEAAKYKLLQPLSGSFVYALN